MRFILFLIIQFLLLLNMAIAQDITLSKRLLKTYADDFQPIQNNDENIDPNVIALGKKIFFDTRLSTNQKMSCGTCHIPEKAFSDNHPTAIGNQGRPLRRKTMTLYHIADDEQFFWDGRGTSLEAQFAEALQNPLEMNFSFPKALEIMHQDSDYQDLFQKAHKEITQKAIINSVVHYVKSIKPPHTRFDKWLIGDLSALNDTELMGFEIFNTKANCTACHMGNHFKDGLLNDVGLDDQDLGYGEITKNPDDFHMFKTPSLRGIALHAPYMHDGSLKTLEEVIKHYDDPNFKRGKTDIPIPEKQGDVIAFHNFTQPLNLTPQEQVALIAFLKTL